jgi:hypothetical protein
MLQRALDRFLQLLIVFIICSSLSFSSAHPTKVWEFVTPYVGNLAFDVVRWTFDALWVKAQQAALGAPTYFDHEARKQIVAEYLRVVQDVQQTQNRISEIYSDPNIEDHDAASLSLRDQLKEFKKRQDNLAPLVEAILQDQVSTALKELDLTTLGQPIPAVQYHVTPLPMALIISPRDTIRQDGNFLLLPDLPVEEQEQVEASIARVLNVSTLVVPVGGLGAYPTMVMRTTNLNWMAEVVAHEWIHNYLTLRPLGINYETTPELRTMNETTASIAGTEIGGWVLQTFYPERTAASDPAQFFNVLRQNASAPQTPPRTEFDFRAEMHITRVNVDEMLAAGKTLEAEAYMEYRRKYFWEHGYAIRKLNQAYFAFYGAYADVPGGAAGEDPVGPAVRALRERSGSLAEFVNRIAMMTSFAELRAAVETSQP